MEHFIVSILGTLLLPLFILVVLASTAGIKPEAILMPVFGLLGVFLKLAFDLVALVVRILAGVVVTMTARIFNVR
jgi:hypothetical protein